jgi:hypothetical protein
MLSKKIHSNKQSQTVAYHQQVGFADDQTAHDLYQNDMALDIH